MKFLTVLIIIFFYRNWIGENPLRSRMPFDQYAGWFRSSLSSPEVRLLLCIGLPVLIVWLLSFELWYWAFGLPWLLLSLIVMLFAIEVVDAEALFGEHAQTLQEMDGNTSVDEASEAQDAFKERAIYEVFQSLYPALFWFLVLGPAGALAYALARGYLDELDDDDEELSLAEGLVFWLEWPAAKVNGFLFALVGHFGKCFEEWVGSLLDTRRPISESLVIAACAASGHAESKTSIAEFVRTCQEHNFELKELLGRLSFGWLGLAAVVAIFGP